MAQPASPDSRAAKRKAKNARKKAREKAKTKAKSDDQQRQDAIRPILRMQELEELSAQRDDVMATPIRSLGSWVHKYPLRAQSSGSVDRWDCLKEIESLSAHFSGRGHRVMCARKGPRKWVSRDRATRLRLRLEELEGETRQNKADGATGAFLYPPQPIPTQTSSLVSLNVSEQCASKEARLLEKKEEVRQTTAECASGAIDFTPPRLALTQTSSFVVLDIPSLPCPPRPLPPPQRPRRATPSISHAHSFTAAERALSLPINFDGMLPPPPLPAHSTPASRPRRLSLSPRSPSAFVSVRSSAPTVPACTPMRSRAGLVDRFSPSLQQSATTIQPGPALTPSFSRSLHHPSLSSPPFLPPTATWAHTLLPPATPTHTQHPHRLSHRNSHILSTPLRISAPAFLPSSPLSSPTHTLHTPVSPPPHRHSGVWPCCRIPITTQKPCFATPYAKHTSAWAPSLHSASCFPVLTPRHVSLIPPHPIPLLSSQPRIRSARRAA